MSQLHKRFTSDQVKQLLERYVKDEIERKYIQEILGIRKRRFFMLLIHLIRTCVRKDVTQIQQTQKILNQELLRYNHQQVHSTTQEIPYLRFQRALQEKQSLFREFKIRLLFNRSKISSALE